MSPRPPSERSSLRAPVPDPSGAQEGVVPSGTVLDDAALQRLRDLDPDGRSKLLARVAQAFEASLGRLLPQLRAAQAAGDAEGIRHVAHTLKSSAASIGAVKLSRMCADMEAMARDRQTDGLHDRISALAAELVPVLEALKHVTETHP